MLFFFFIFAEKTNDIMKGDDRYGIISNLINNFNTANRYYGGSHQCWWRYRNNII